MDVNSLKRQLNLVVGVALTLVGAKLGLPAPVLAMVSGLFGVFLAQSGVNAALGKLAASKAGSDLAKVESLVASVHAAILNVQAGQNKATGAAAGAAPSNASNA